MSAVNFSGLQQHLARSVDLSTLRRRIVPATSLFLGGTAILIAVLIAVTQPGVTINGIPVPLFVGLIGMVNLGLFILSRVNLRAASIGLMIIMVMATWLNTPGAARLSFVTLFIGAVVTERRTWRLVLLAILGHMVYEIIYVAGVGGADGTSEASVLLATNVITLITSLGIRYVNNFTGKAVDASQRTAVLLRTAAEIGAVSIQLSDLKSLFERVVTLIQERFGFYHVQVFVVNASGDQAVLQASTGEIGRRLLARRHQLAVGSQSVIGQVTLRGEYVIARDTDRDEVHFRNELLINTRSELAVPIRDGVLVVGALDVQSTEPDTFDPIDVEALQVIADFLGTALRNAAIYEGQEQTAEENRALLRDAEENNLRIQRLNRELTRASWDSFIQSEHAQRGVDLSGSQLVTREEWSPQLEAAALEKRTVTIREGDQSKIAVPLTLRGEVIGAIEVESGSETDPNTIALMEDLAERMAISLENARLYEEAREATGQEQFINRLSAQYQSVSTVDDLLRVTLLQVTESLGAKQGTIRLGKLELGEDGSNGASAS